MRQQAWTRSQHNSQQQSMATETKDQHDQHPHLQLQSAQLLISISLHKDNLYVEIYPKLLIAYHLKKQSKVVIESIYQLSTTSEDIDKHNTKTEDELPSVNIDRSNPYKIIYFNDSNYAFYIEEEKKVIEIHNISGEDEEKIELSLAVGNTKNLLLLQSILRKKLSEIGFDKKYRIKSELGKGASAKVYLIERLTDGKLFAAKIISVEDSNPKSQELFINESKLLKILNHPNIIHLESLFICQKQLIQVLEYLDGGTLFEALKKKKIVSEAQCVKVLSDIASGLEHLRQKRVIHRDLKLENVLIRKKHGKLEYVLSDFGLASWRGCKSSKFDKCGTPGYIAPEILHYDNSKIRFDHKSDIFSFGVIAHILFIKTPPFPYKGNLKQLIKLNQKAKINFNDKIYDQLPHWQYEILLKTLNKKPESRISSNIILSQYLPECYEKQVRSPGLNSRKVFANGDQSSTKVKVKGEESVEIRKKSLSLTAKLKQTSQQQKQRPSSAAKFFREIWKGIVASKPQKAVLKYKQNSRDKQKILSQYI